MKKIQLRILSYLVMVYMLLAFSWWSVLLFLKNQDAFQAKSNFLELVMVADGRVTPQAPFEISPEYLELKKKYDRQERMIFGEAAVFVLSLIAGIWLINRAYHREVVAADQRRNFLLSITHELKSPIASIQLILQTFLKHNGLSMDKKEQLCENGLAETGRLNQLVNDLLLAAKMEKSYVPHFEDLELEPLLLAAVDNVRIKYPEADINYSIAPGVSNFKADRQGMLTIFINLLENAAKYSNEEAKIAISAFLCDEKLCLDFADNGKGISDADKKRIFQRFFRVGDEDTRSTKGTGLGLYIVRQVIRSHKGKIHVADNVPSGSVFRISLPLNHTT